MAENIRAGISTEQINKWVDDKTRELGGIPAPLGYEGFPKSVCTSINDEVCHGIPSEDVILKEGDIINVDVSTIYKGYFSDSSRMFIIGKTTPDKEKLVRVAKECVEEGIKEMCIRDRPPTVRTACRHLYKSSIHYRRPDKFQLFRRLPSAQS